MVSSKPPVHLLLTVHSSSGAAVWDMRAQRLVAVISGGGLGSGAASGRTHSKSAAAAALGRGGGGSGANVQVTAAAWLGGGPRGDFATGHANGEVLVWALPKGEGSDGASGGQQSPEGGRQQQAARGDGERRAGGGGGGGGGCGGEQQLQPRLLSRLRVVQAGVARPVVSIEYLESGSKEALLVSGGQELDRPNGLALLPLPLPTEVSKGLWKLLTGQLKNVSIQSHSVPPLHVYALGVLARFNRLDEHEYLLAANRTAGVWPGHTLRPKRRRQQRGREPLHVQPQKEHPRPLSIPPSFLSSCLEAALVRPHLLPLPGAFSGLHRHYPGPCSDPGAARTGRYYRA